VLLFFFVWARLILCRRNLRVRADRDWAAVFGRLIRGARVLNDPTYDL